VTPSNIKNQANEDGNKRKRVDFVEEVEITSTDACAECEVTNPLIALFENKNAEDGNDCKG